MSDDCATLAYNIRKFRDYAELAEADCDAAKAAGDQERADLRCEEARGYRETETKLRMQYREQGCPPFEG